MRSCRLAFGATTAAAVVALMLVCLTAQNVQGAFTATVTNSVGTIGTPTTFLTATATSPLAEQCTTIPAGSTIPATSSFTCIGSTHVLATQATGAAVVTTTSSLSTMIATTGTTSPTTASFRALSCAPVQLDNPTLATDPLLARGDIGFNQTGPMTGSGSLSMNGLSTMGSEPLTTSTTGTMTMAVWFKATPGSAGGVLVALDAAPAQSSAATTYRTIWLDASGTVRYGQQLATAVSGRRTVSSTGTDFRDGLWHLVVGRLSSSGGISTMELFVDNASKGTSALTTTAKTWVGYWHVGWGDVNGATNWVAGTGQNNYFAGSLSNVVVFNTALTPAQRTSLFTAASQTAWNSAVSGIGGVTAHWPLADTGLSTYTGLSFGSVSVATLCSRIRVLVDDTSTPSCVYPSSPSALCPAMANGINLSTLSTVGQVPLKPSTIAQSQTITTTAARTTGYVSTNMVGLHLLVPLTITETVASFSYTLNWPGNRFVI